MMIKNFTRRFLLGLLTLTALSWNHSPAFSQATAEQEAPPKVTLKLASIFSDHMVLQRGREVPIWGTAAPGSEVTVQIDGQSTLTTTGTDGHWRVDIEQLAVNDTPLELQVASGDTTVTFTDILVGDVWIASGQSNMEWAVANSNDAEKEISMADFPEIRIWDAPHVSAAKPRDNVKNTGWHHCQPQSIKRFSAVAYFFGRELHETQGVPIGLIGVNWGGTPMEAWTSRVALQSKPNFVGSAKVATDALESKKDLGGHHPSGLFNGMLHPVIPFGIRGAIWYQGESNAGRHAQYHELSELMISDWRERWGQGDFPFLLVQLAAWRPDAKDWPYLRESQLRTVQTLPQVGMAVATDIGHKSDIHPRNKQAVGHRLALAARALAHDEDVVYSGPIYKRMLTRNGSAYLDFDHLGGGLTSQGDTLQGFEVAGADRKFVVATAKIVGDQVVVSSEEVAHPTAVRFNWTGWTEGNLFNAAGLPASPFRTDRY